MAIIFKGRNTIISKTDENTTLQWSISPRDGSTINTIRAYVQFQSERKTQIATWENSRLFVVNEGKKIYGDRLIADFTDNILFLKIIKVQYKDSGTYSIDVFVKPLASANSAATLNVYGMFLVILNAYYHFGKWSMHFGEVINVLSDI